MAIHTDHTERINQEGDFLGAIIETVVKRESSGAVGVWFCVAIEEVWDSVENTWIDWRAYRLFASGTVYIVKKDGTLNLKSIESLGKSIGFAGDLLSFQNGRFDGNRVRITVKASQSNGKVYHDIAWINSPDSVPPVGFSPTPIDDQDLRQLQQRFQGQLRSIASAGRSAAPPPVPTRPMAAAPQRPKPLPASPPQTTAEWAGGVPEGDDVPF
ncbi:MAG TPA: hypothetical protein DCQ98_09950 [Planctomycetaceae bacterium]|nr:hypothetical protein [Planctomycetaceae bacterium]